jgi:hypothetical protein
MGRLGRNLRRNPLSHLLLGIELLQQVLQFMRILNNICHLLVLDRAFDRHTECSSQHGFCLLVGLARVRSFLTCGSSLVLEIAHHGEHGLLELSLNCFESFKLFGLFQELLINFRVAGFAQKNHLFVPSIVSLKAFKLCNLSNVRLEQSKEDW